MVSMSLGIDFSCEFRVKKEAPCLWAGYMSGMKYYPVIRGLFHKPLQGSPLNNQDSVESIWPFIFVAHVISIELDIYFWVS